MFDNKIVAITVGTGSFGLHVLKRFLATPVSEIRIFSRDERKQEEMRIIGRRHGEKLYESLVSREEMARVEQMDQYYRIPADNRDLNYAMYVTDGMEEISKAEDYTSHNTRRLEVVELKQLLLGLDFIQSELCSETGRAQEVLF